MTSLPFTKTKQIFVDHPKWVWWARRKEKKYRMWNVCAAGCKHWERYARKKSVTFFEAKRTIVWSGATTKMQTLNGDSLLRLARSGVSFNGNFASWWAYKNTISRDPPLDIGMHSGSLTFRPGRHRYPGFEQMQIWISPANDIETSSCDWRVTSGLLPKRCRSLAPPRARQRKQTMRKKKLNSCNPSLPLMTWRFRVVKVVDDCSSIKRDWRANDDRSNLPSARGVIAERCDYMTLLFSSAGI